jgi:hypothetical protein
MLEKHKETVKFLKKGRSIRETALLVKQSTRTVQKVKKAMAE